MRSATLTATLLLAVQTYAQAADPADAWRGVKVLPKSSAKVKIGNESVEGRKLHLPWVVQDVNGEWLWVGSHRKGWVQRSHVVTLDEAPAYYTGLINSNQQKAWAYRLRGFAWKEKGDLDLAIADFGDSLRLDPTAATYNNRGEAWRAKKEFEKAIADYSQAIRLEPGYALGYSNRGHVFYQMNDNDKAIEDCSRAIALDPKFATAYGNRGNAWNGKKDYDKAIADFGEAIRFDQNSAFAYNGRGTAWRGKGEHDKAIADYSKAVALNPKFAAAYCNRGNTWLTMREHDKAIADYSQALALDPKYAQAYTGRGSAWSSKKEYSKAIADYSQAIGLAPTSPFAFNAAAWLRATCPDERYRDGEKAVELAKKACELSGWTVAKDLDTLAAAYAEAGDFDSAIKYQNKAIEPIPTDTKFVEGANERLELYKSNKPFHVE